MSIDIRKGTHKWGFLSKVASAQTGSPHIYNITLAADHDNFDLVLKGAWKAFDNYNEDTTGSISFTGVVQDKAADGTWYVEVVSTNALLVYNSPVSPYAEKEFQDESLFFNKQGETAEGFSLIAGDIISVSESAFSSAPTKGDAVTGFSAGKYQI